MSALVKIEETYLKLFKTIKSKAGISDRPITWCTSLTGANRSKAVLAFQKL